MAPQFNDLTTEINSFNDQPGKFFLLGKWRVWTLSDSKGSRLRKPAAFYPGSSLSNKIGYHGVNEVLLDKVVENLSGKHHWVMKQIGKYASSHQKITHMSLESLPIA